MISSLTIVDDDGRVFSFTDTGGIDGIRVTITGPPSYTEAMHYVPETDPMGFLMRAGLRLDHHRFHTLTTLIEALNAHVASRTARQQGAAALSREISAQNKRKQAAREERRYQRLTKGQT